ncbi:hypothetical protein [Pedobacter sp.]|uniref:hypothetical protein n=1 Tax=Pedobacter sp. TaxID=1411316 RepID=UPI003BA8D87D
MTNQKQFTQNTSQKTMLKYALKGGSLALMLSVSFILFLILASETKFGFWAILSAVSVTFTGFCGGAIYSLINNFMQLYGWKKTAFNVLFAVLFCVSLWLSLILALAATGLWD